MLRIYLVILLFLPVLSTVSQTTYIPLNHSSTYFLERIEVKSGRISNEFHSNIKPFTRKATVQYLEGLSSAEYYSLSKIDRENIDFIKDDNWEFLTDDTTKHNHKPLLKYIFKKKNDFVYFEGNDFNIQASPILNVGTGVNSSYGNLKRRNPIINTRGVEIRVNLSDKIGFYTMMTDNNSLATNQLKRYYLQHQGFPYESFVKIIKEDEEKMNLDYFQALGYFTLKPLKNLQMTFGHDKNFVGHGQRSLILSDFSAPYLQMKLDLQLGRIQFQNIFAQMTNKQIETIPYSQEVNTPKYFSFHHLNVNITDYLNVGIFENVVFGNRKTGFDLNYLNPVIFYRFIEGYLGSPDNAMVGLDYKLNLFKTLSLYGQFVLDEYSKEDFKEDRWWAKKYGIQSGLKYYDVLGVENLDLQYEFNRVRPYTYSHFTTFTNYVNYNLPVAHPLGANFKENIISLRYQPTQKLNLEVTQMFAMKGEDKDSLNYGGDIKKINVLDRPKDYGVKVGQGFKNNISYLSLRANYMIWHNIYAELEYVRRKDSYTLAERENLFMAGLRWNFPYRPYMY